MIPGHYTWLLRENARGAHIFVRPEWPHALSLVDDLGADALKEMGKTGFEPAVVVETSPNNFQVWLNHGRVISDRFLSTLVARQLASRFGGDRGSCDWRHFGRLAGFTNQKKERRLLNGFQPFVRLRSSEGCVYSVANEFLREVEALKREHLSRRETREMARPWDNDAPVRPITSFHTDSRYGGDLHRADMRPSKKKGSERLRSGWKSKAAGNRWLAELLGITPNECTDYQQ